MLGMDYYFFWKSNPRIIKAYETTYKMNRKRIDEEFWLQGLYVRDAFAETLDGFFNGKSAKCKYPEKPWASIEKTEGLSEEEKIRRTEALFMNLQIMGENFNLSKGGDN